MITDVAGVLVGQSERIGDGWLTGVTVVVPPAGSIVAVDVRGGGPGTRETDVLAAGVAHAIVLAGGSAYGLAAATGVQQWCEETGRGLPIMPGVIVPIVPAAVIFDVGRGGDPALRPDAEMGYAAAVSASDGAVRTGCVGAGTGAVFASVGLKGGVGTARVRLPGDVVVAALVVANAYGSPYRSGSAGVVDGEPREASTDSTAHTTLAVVATNARLSHARVQRMALAGHDGIARAIQPVHTLVDGDTVFGFATGTTDPLPPDGWSGDPSVGGALAVHAAAADVVTLAIRDAILSATSVAGFTAYRDTLPS